MVRAKNARTHFARAPYYRLKLMYGANSIKWVTKNAIKLNKQTTFINETQLYRKWQLTV